MAAITGDAAQTAAREQQENATWSLTYGGESRHILEALVKMLAEDTVAGMWFVEILTEGGEMHAGEIFYNRSTRVITLEGEDVVRIDVDDVRSINIP